jgi:trimeric autotransporter adhesin
VTVAVQDDGNTDSPQTVAIAFGTSTVTDAPLAVTVNNVKASEGKLFAGPVATFTDAGGPGEALNYKVMIDWGDGTPAGAAGTVTPVAANTFQVAGNHTYAEGGGYKVKVTVQDDGATATLGVSAQASGTAAVADAALQATGVNVTSVEGNAVTGVLAAFTDTGPGGTAGQYKATVNWGDGSPLDATATITARSGGVFTVTGKHTYADAGNFPITVMIRDAGGGGVSAAAFAHIGDSPLQVVGATVTVPRGVTANLVRVATFSDAGPGHAGDFSATINWGDGTPTASGIIAGIGSGTTYYVLGTHTFATPGKFVIQVFIRDKGGSSINVISNAVVGSANERYVAQLFRDLLQRPVDPGSLASWAGTLDRGGSRSQVALALEQSQEYRTALVQSWYRAVLHRSADPSGLAGTLQFLAAGGTDEQARAALIGSAEYYQNRGGGTVGGFLTAVYQDVLGQNIDPVAQTFFTGELAGGTPRSAVAMQVLTSVTGERALVQSIYQHYLHRAADTGGVNHYLQFLQQGGLDEEIVAQLVGSAEYAVRL